MSVYNHLCSLEPWGIIKENKYIKESYNSEVDLMYDYEKIFKKKGWRVNRTLDKNHKSYSAMNISIHKDTDDGQVCFYIYCDWGIDDCGDYYSCQINDSSSTDYDYSAVNYKGFEVSGRGFLLFERNVDKFCKYLEQTLNELADLKVEIKENKSIKESVEFDYDNHSGVFFAYVDGSDLSIAYAPRKYEDLSGWDISKDGELLTYDCWEDKSDEYVLNSIKEFEKQLKKYFDTADVKIIMKDFHEKVGKYI